MMASLAPFGAAMADVSDSAFAGVAAFFVLMLALVLQLKRPPTMPRILAKGHAVVALAFVIDATRAGQPLRFVGAFLCLALIAWMTSLQPPRRDLPGLV
jgi:hypothetical protein